MYRVLHLKANSNRNNHVTECIIFPQVTIIVLNWNSFEDTLDCVKRIEAIEYPALQVLIVDNASSDGSPDKIRARFPRVPILQNERNLGYAEGNNVGIRQALVMGADYIFVVNPDVRLPSDSVSAYVRLMEADSSISALNPVQLMDEGGAIDEFFRREMFDRNDYPTPSLPMQEDICWDVRRLFGAALFISRNTLEKVGGFDPLYFAYWEEIDLCRRIRRHGGKLVVTSSAPVVHLRSYRAKGHDPFRAFLRLKGMQLFKLKDPDVPLRDQAKTIILELARNVIRPPHNEFGWRRRDYLRTAIWILRNLYQIRIHRDKDRLGNAYL